MKRNKGISPVGLSLACENEAYYFIELLVAFPCFGRLLPLLAVLSERCTISEYSAFKSDRESHIR